MERKVFLSMALADIASPAGIGICFDDVRDKGNIKDSGNFSVYN